LPSLFHAAVAIGAAYDARKIHARNIQIVTLKDEIKGLSL
jgi:hypothetical protein